MLVSRIEYYVNKHNAHEIEITSIEGAARTLIDGISFAGDLKYITGQFRLEYKAPDGTVKSIMNVRDIVGFNFKDVSDDDTNNGSSDGGNTSGSTGSNTNGSSTDNGFSGDDSYGSFFYGDDANKIIDGELLSQAKYKNGILYPARLVDGTLIYPAKYARLVNKEIFNETGSVHADKYATYSDDGYLELLKGGFGKLKLGLPAAGKYAMKVIVGSPDNLGKTGSIFINNMMANIVAKTQHKNKWQLVSPLEKFTQERPPITEVIFPKDVVDVQLEQAMGDSSVLDIDSIILLPLTMNTASDVDVHKGYDPINIDNGNMYALGVDKSYLYTAQDEPHGGYKITNPLVNDSRYLTPELMTLNNSELLFSVNVPADGRYHIGLLVQNTKYTRDGQFVMTINNDTKESNQLVGNFTKTPDNAEEDNIVYSIPFSYQYGGEINIPMGGDSVVLLHSGMNHFKIKNYRSGMIHKESPLINGILLSTSDQYFAKSNNNGKQVLPNIDDMYFFNTPKEINAKLRLPGKEDKNSINIRDSYPADQYGFSFGIKNFNILDQDVDTNLIKYDIEFSAPKSALGEETSITQIYNTHMERSLAPKVTIVASPIVPDGSSRISRYVKLSFYLYSFDSLVVYDFVDASSIIREKVFDNAIEAIPQIPDYKYDLGENWKERYLAMEGITMADKVYIWNEINKDTNSSTHVHDDCACCKK